MEVLVKWEGSTFPQSTEEVKVMNSEPEVRLGSNQVLRELGREWLCGSLRDHPGGGWQTGNRVPEASRYGLRRPRQEPGQPRSLKSNS